MFTSFDFKIDSRHTQLNLLGTIFDIFMGINNTINNFDRSYVCILLVFDFMPNNTKMKPKHISSRITQDIFYKVINLKNIL